MHLFKKILVPTDFSENAGNALAYAIEIAQRTGGKLILLHAYNIPATYVDASIAGFDTVATELKQNAEEKLNNLVNQFAALQNIPHETISQMGFIIDVILNTAEENAADLIVMGTQGVSGFAEIIFGSNTSAVIEKSKTTVLAVPPEAAFEEHINIAFAWDRQPVEKGKLSILRDIAELYKSSISVVTVSKSHEPNEVRMELIQNSAVEKVLKDIDHSYFFSENDDVVEGLSNYVLKNDIKLLITVHRKHNFIEKLFGKSVTKSLVHHTKIPLLVIQSESR